MQLKVYVVHRQNMLIGQIGWEYAVNAQIGDGRPFTLIATKEKPTKEELDRYVEIAYRSMQFYHETIKVPRFTLEVEVD